MKTKKKPSLDKVYTDGSCLKNPGGPGGWAIVFGDGRSFSGYDVKTTSNRMEMQAVIEALLRINTPKPVTIYTDSKYVQKGATIWMKGWKKDGWYRAGKKPLKNRDLWIKIDQLVAGKNIYWEWIKAHSGNPFNEWADELARQQATLAATVGKKLKKHEKRPREPPSLVDLILPEFPSTFD